MSTILPADPGSRISLCARGFGEWQFLANNNPIQTEAPKLVSSGNYVVDCQGYEIAYQSPPIFPNRWMVNLSSTSPHLIDRLGRGNIILEDITLEGAVNKPSVTSTGGGNSVKANAIVQGRSLA